MKIEKNIYSLPTRAMQLWSGDRWLRSRIIILGGEKIIFGGRFGEDSGGVSRRSAGEIPTVASEKTKYLWWHKNEINENRKNTSRTSDTDLCSGDRWFRQKIFISGWMKNNIRRVLDFVVTRQSAGRIPRDIPTTARTFLFPTANFMIFFVETV